MSNPSSRRPSTGVGRYGNAAARKVASTADAEPRTRPTRYSDSGASILSGFTATGTEPALTTPAQAAARTTSRANSVFSDTFSEDEPRSSSFADARASPKRTAQPDAVAAAAALPAALAPLRTPTGAPIATSAAPAELRLAPAATSAASPQLGSGRASAPTPLLRAVSESIMTDSAWLQAQMTRVKSARNLLGIPSDTLTGLTDGLLSMNAETNGTPTRAMIAPPRLVQRAHLPPVRFHFFGGGRMATDILLTLLSDDAEGGDGGRKAGKLTPAAFRSIVWLMGRVGPALDVVQDASTPAPSGSSTSDRANASPFSYQRALLSGNFASVTDSRHNFTMMVAPQAPSVMSVAAAAVPPSGGDASASFSRRESVSVALHRSHSATSAVTEDGAAAMPSAALVDVPAVRLGADGADMPRKRRQAPDEQAESTIVDSELRCLPTAAKGLQSRRFVAAAASWSNSLLLTATGDVFQWQVSPAAPLEEAVEETGDADGASSDAEEAARAKQEVVSPAQPPVASDIASPRRSASRRSLAKADAPATTASYACPGRVSGPLLVSALAWERALKGVRIVAVACGPQHCVALSSGPHCDVYTWGSGADGRLGHASERDEPAPRVVVSLIPYRVTSIAAGGAHTAAITMGGIDLHDVEVHQVAADDTSGPITRGGSAAGFGLGDLPEDSLHASDETRSVHTDATGTERGGPSPGKSLRPSGRAPLPAAVAAQFTSVSSASLQHHAGTKTGNDSLGAVWTWGRGRNGRLGHANLDNQLVPKRVRGIVRVRHRVLDPITSSIVARDRGRLPAASFASARNTVASMPPSGALARQTSLPASSAAAATRKFASGYSRHRHLEAGGAAASPVPLPVKMTPREMLEQLRTGSRAVPPATPAPVDARSRSTAAAQSRPGGSGAGRGGSSGTGSLRERAVCVQIACGRSFTVAVTSDGDVWTWGRATEGQCATDVRRLAAASTNTIAAMAAIRGSSSSAPAAHAGERLLVSNGIDVLQPVRVVFPAPMHTTSRRNVAVAARAVLDSMDPVTAELACPFALDDGDAAMPTYATSSGSRSARAVGGGFMSPQPSTSPPTSPHMHPAMNASSDVSFRGDADTGADTRSVLQSDIDDGASLDADETASVYASARGGSSIDTVYWAVGVPPAASLNDAYASPTSPQEVGSPSAPDSALNLPPDSARIVRIAAGHSHVICCARDGSVWGWGLNTSGQAGTGRVRVLDAPAQVSVSLLLQARTDASAAHEHSGAFMEAAAVERRALHQPDGSAAAAVNPLTLHGVDPSLDPVVAVYTGAFHSLAATAGGALVAWGRNYEGTLGVGETNVSSRPEVVQPLGKVAVRSQGVVKGKRRSGRAGTDAAPPPLREVSPGAGSADSASSATLATPLAVGSTDPVTFEAKTVEDAPPLAARPIPPARSSFPSMRASSGPAMLRVGRPWRRILDIACGKDFTLILEAPVPRAPPAPPRKTPAPPTPNAAGQAPVVAVTVTADAFAGAVALHTINEASMTDADAVDTSVADGKDSHAPVLPPDIRNTSMDVSITSDSALLQRRVSFRGSGSDAAHGGALSLDTADAEVRHVIASNDTSAHETSGRNRADARVSTHAAGGPSVFATPYGTPPGTSPSILDAAAAATPPPLPAPATAMPRRTPSALVVVGAAAPPDAAPSTPAAPAVASRARPGTASPAGMVLPTTGRAVSYGLRAVTSAFTTSDAASVADTASVGGSTSGYMLSMQPRAHATRSANVLADPEIARIRDDAYKRARARQMEELRICALAKSWDDFLQSFRGSWDALLLTEARVQLLWRHGLPPAMRSRVWPLVIGNRLHVTPALYDLCRQRAISVRQVLQLQAHAERHAKRRSRASADAAHMGSSASRRGSTRYPAMPESNGIDSRRGSAAVAGVMPPGNAMSRRTSAAALPPVLEGGGNRRQSVRFGALPVAPAKADVPTTSLAEAEPRRSLARARSSIPSVSGAALASSGGDALQALSAAATSTVARRSSGLSSAASSRRASVSAAAPASAFMLPPECFFHGREDSIKLVATDMPRTYPSLHMFGPEESPSEGPLYHLVRDVLEAIVVLRPELGYVQGMSYIAAVLALFLTGAVVTVAPWEPGGAFQQTATTAAGTADASTQAAASSTTTTMTATPLLRFAASVSVLQAAADEAGAVAARDAPKSGRGTGTSGRDKDKDAHALLGGGVGVDVALVVPSGSHALRVSSALSSMAVLLASGARSLFSRSSLSLQLVPPEPRTPNATTEAVDVSAEAAVAAVPATRLPARSESWSLFSTIFGGGSTAAAASAAAAKEAAAARAAIPLQRARRIVTAHALPAQALTVGDDRFLVFTCLANLLTRDHLYAFFATDPGPLNSYYDIFDRMLWARSPKLAAFFYENCILTEMYLFGWFQTLFCKYVPLPTAVRILDMYLLESTPYLYRVALALMDLLAPHILPSDSSYEDAVQLLTQAPSKQRVWEAIAAPESLFPAVEAVILPADAQLEIVELITNPFFYRTAAGPRPGMAPAPVAPGSTASGRPSQTRRSTWSATTAAPVVVEQDVWRPSDRERERERVQSVASDAAAAACGYEVIDVVPTDETAVLPAGHLQSARSSASSSSGAQLQRAATLSTPVAAAPPQPAGAVAKSTPGSATSQTSSGTPDFRDF